MELLVQLLANPWMLALCIIVGFTILVLGADWLVDGASGLAKRFNISDLAIGMTVVAFGTSMPEFVVNMVSVADGETEFAITNILGSNIFNVFFILGVSSLVYPIASQRYSRKVDIPLSAFAALVVMTLILVNLPSEVSSEGNAGGMTRVGGIVMLVFFALFLWQTFRNAKVSPDEAETYQPMKTWKAVALILLGLAGLVVGGRMIVTGATHIAEGFGLSKEVIGLTILAVGTSLPELATSMMAAFRRNSDIAIGNVVGSNIFNVFFILGTSATIRPLPSYDGLLRDVLMAVVGSVLLWIIVMTDRQHKINRAGGLVLMSGYIVYVTYLLMNL